MTLAQRLRELHGQATPGPWRLALDAADAEAWHAQYEVDVDTIILHGPREEAEPVASTNDDGAPTIAELANAELIVALRNALPDLLAHLATLQSITQERDALAGFCANQKTTIFAQIESVVTLKAELTALRAEQARLRAALKMAAHELYRAMSSETDNEWSHVSRAHRSIQAALTASSQAGTSMETLRVALTTLHDAAAEYAVAMGSPHEDDCPSDDTCECKFAPMLARLRAAFRQASDLIASAPVEAPAEPQPIRVGGFGLDGCSCAVTVVEDCPVHGETPVEPQE